MKRPYSEGTLFLVPHLLTGSKDKNVAGFQSTMQIGLSCALLFGRSLRACCPNRKARKSGRGWACWPREFVAYRKFSRCCGSQSNSVRHGGCLYVVGSQRGAERRRGESLVLQNESKVGMARQSVPHPGPRVF